MMQKTIPNIKGKEYSFYTHTPHIERSTPRRCMRKYLMIYNDVSFEGNR